MKISFYELLGLINENKPPKEIKYEDDIYTYDEDKNDYITVDFPLGLMDVMNDFDFLKKEIEIIEEKPKKVKQIEVDNSHIVDYDETGKHYLTTNRKDRNIYIKKINELTKALNYLLEKSDKDE